MDRFPARRQGEHAGTGVQHIALAAADIFAVAGSLRAAGLAVLRMPRNYYDDLAARFDLPEPVLARMHDLGILYDEDEHGSFHQLYTRHFRRRFCFEVVQRNGYRGFGAANAPVRISMQTRELALA